MHSTNTTAVDTNSTSSQIQVITEPLWFVILRLSIESVIAFAGVVGNVLVCYVVTRHSNFQTAGHIYIRNVAVGDLGTLIISFPLAVIHERVPHWPLGEFGCRVIYPLADIFYGVSVWSIAAIAFHRYKVMSSNTLLAGASLRTSRIVCALIWVLSLVIISLPLLLLLEYHNQPSLHPRCVHVWPEHLALLRPAYNIAVPIITYFLPLSAIFASYFIVKRKVYTSQSFHIEMAECSSSGNWRSDQIQRVKQRSKMMHRMMVPVVAVFAISILPLSVFRVLVIFLSQNIVFTKYIYVMYNASVFSL